MPMNPFVFILQNSDGALQGVQITLILIPD